MTRRQCLSLTSAALGAAVAKPRWGREAGPESSFFGTYEVEADGFKSWRVRLHAGDPSEQTIRVEKA